MFCSEFRPKIKGEHPGLSIGDVAKKLGEMWNNTAADDKQPYEKKAAKLKEKYEKVTLTFRDMLWGGHASAFWTLFSLLSTLIPDVANYSMLMMYFIRFVEKGCMQGQMIHWHNSKLESFTLNCLHLSVVLTFYWCLNKYCGLCTVTKSISHSII